jgi:hypothetical protein
VVLPKLVGIENAKDLVGRGGDDAHPKPTTFLPTDGTFRTRELVPGDDTRRIHWVRSVNAGKLIVRLPDEIPANEPTIRLVLDTEMHHVNGLATTAPEEVLDALVRVWLAIGKTMVEEGRRVTLVAVADGKVVEKVMIPRSREAAKLGARVTWQDGVRLQNTLEDCVAQIVVSCRPRAVVRGEGARDLTWIVVPSRMWATSSPLLPSPSAIVLPFPIGHAENRGARRLRERRRIEGVLRDRTYFDQLATAIDWSVTGGGFVARPQSGKIQLAVIK